MPEKAGTAAVERTHIDSPRPERRIGPKGILGLLCAISLLVFADRGTTLVLQLNDMPYTSHATICHTVLPMATWQGLIVWAICRHHQQQRCDRFTGN